MLHDMRSISDPTTEPTSDTAPNEAPASPSDSTVEAILTEVGGWIGELKCASMGRLVQGRVSMSQLHVLWLLQHHGEMPMSRLAELLDVSVSNATGLIDRMEERGLVERVRVPDDRRVVIVRASAEGSRRRDEIEALKQDGMRSILGRLTPDQLTRIHAAVGDLRAAVLDEIGSDHLHSHPRTT
jgi:DNA-binding MarR family transcriptional regulator